MITLLAFEIAVAPGWAVGTVTLDDSLPEQALLRDATGEPWIPGSALAGSLRAHLDPDLARALMGSPPPSTGQNDTEASRLWLLGTRFQPAAGERAAVELVGQTAIDRRRGAATGTLLRHRQMVGSGGTLTAYARYDGELAPAELDTLAAWRPAVGRGRSTGAGRCQLVRLRYGTIDPATEGGMRTWLTYAGPELVEKVATTARAGKPPPDPWLTADLLVEDALLVADQRLDGEAGDGTPTTVVMPRRRGGAPLVPGSAWKGLFRSRAEYILRSLYGEAAACTRHHGCGTCPTCRLFGHQGSRGLLAFHDATVQDAATTDRTQVAIDRVTGGARDGLLFQTQPVTAGRLTLRVDRLGADEPPPWARQLLLHTLRDLHDGLIGMGSRVTRGMGTLRLADPSKVLRELAPVRVPAEDLPTTDQPTAEAAS